jgi:hypothetical protein
MRFEHGSCIVEPLHPSGISRRSSIRNCEGGLTTMDASDPRRSGPSSCMSATRWFAGLAGNTRSCVITVAELGIGCSLSPRDSRTCLPCGPDRAVGFTIGAG